MECGQAAPSTTSPAPVVPPQSYTPRHLADKILAGRDALAGERKQVTVLFADVVGSTDLIQSRDPEEAQALLDGIVQRMMDAVHRFEGTVSRLMGDGLMAMFGAPVAHEDHAVRACYAALAMLDAAHAYADEVRESHGATIQVRIGLNSGEVIVRLISDDLHMDYTAMGQTVHLAARMESLARADTVLLAASTMTLVEGFVEARPLGPTPVKGIDHPVEVFEVVGVGPARSRLDASATRGFTRFVGRERELELVRAAIRRAAAGHGQVVALVGDPGVGKSRLVHEITGAPEVADWLVLQGAAMSYGTSTTYLPFVDLLKGYVGIEPADDANAIRDRVTARVVGLDPTLATVVAPLLALLDVTQEDPAWANLDPPRRRRATFDAVERLLIRQSQGQPVMLVIEDLHWIDSESQALLDELVDLLPSTRLLLLVNYRPEYTHSWGNKSAYSQIRLDPLETDGADALLQSLIGEAPTLDPLKHRLIERTGGNPLFLEESVRSLVETGALVGERGSYALARDVETVQVPATVQAILAARIDRLEPEAKRLLQTAAVIGKDVPLVLLQDVADMPADTIHGLLARLQTAELVYPTTLFPEPEYTFKHALTHEVAYGSLLQERRRELHRRLVHTIERLYPERLDERVVPLAYHALRGEDWERSIAYARAAGHKAVARAAYQEGLGWFEQALDTLRRLPEHRDTRSLELDLVLDLRVPVGWMSMRERERACLRQAEALAEAIGDRALLGAIHARMAENLRIVGRFDQSVEAVGRALVLAEETGEAALKAFALQQLGQTARDRGDLRRAADAFLAALDLRVTTADLLRVRLTPVSVNLHPSLVWTLSELGEFDAAIAHGMDGVRDAIERGNPTTEITAHNTLGYAHLQRGDLARAVAEIEHGLRLARSGEAVQPLVWALAERAVAHIIAGEAPSAVALLEEAVRCADRGGIIANRALWGTWLGEAYLAAGRIADARRVVSESLARATDQGERSNLAIALYALGKIKASGDSSDLDEAVGHFREALAEAEGLEMRPLQAHCHLGLGKLYRRTGRPDEARTELSTAIAMLHEMGMTFWLPEAEAELAQLARPSAD